MDRTNPFIKSSSENYSLTVSRYGHFELECYKFTSSSEPVLFVWDKKLRHYNNVGFVYRMSWDASDIKEDLIPIIDEVVERNWGDEVLGSDLMSALIEPNMTYFTSKSDLGEGKKDAIKDPSMHLSTRDFRTISMKWLEFLESLEK